MTTFEKPVTCNRCSKFLKGLFYQGYQCTVCKIAVHKECIKYAGRCSSVPPELYPHPNHLDDAIRDKLWYIIKITTELKLKLKITIDFNYRFAGEMEREAATKALEHRIVGTYLLRIRSQIDDARYALSLKYI